MNNINLIIANEPTISKTSYQLLSKAVELQEFNQCPLHLVIIGHYAKAYYEELQYYPLSLIHYYVTEDDIYLSDLYHHIALSIIKDIEVAIIMCESEDQGKSLASMLAISLHAGLTADCTILTYEDNEFIQIRPAYGGNLMAGIKGINNHISMVSVKENIFDISIKPSSIACPSINYTNTIPLFNSKISINNIYHISKTNNLTSANLVILVGAGLNNKQDLLLIKELATLYGATLACTRSIVQKGWLDSSYQVGLSGQSIKPKTLLCLGVSGCVQLVAGINKCKNIIAVNNDPHALIFNIAHYGYCSDLYPVVELLIKNKKLQNKGE